VPIEEEEEEIHYISTTCFGLFFGHSVYKNFNVIVVFNICKGHASP